jgi:hypothetical protein
MSEQGEPVVLKSGDIIDGGRPSVETQLAVIEFRLEAIDTKLKWLTRGIVAILLIVGGAHGYQVTPDLLKAFTAMAGTGP